mmetsp:Transcript_24981/g.78744  ORF Transcript_24981/g.78744 Transcript_24981/m.78744 type:complete len:200 (-) Transcript_24981:194-793(-)
MGKVPSKSGISRRSAGGGAERKRCSHRKGQRRLRRASATVEILATSPRSRTFCSKRTLARSRARVSPTRLSHRCSSTPRLQAACHLASVLGTSPHGGAGPPSSRSCQPQSKGLGSRSWSRMPAPLCRSSPASTPSEASCSQNPRPLSFSSKASARPRPPRRASSASKRKAKSGSRETRQSTSEADVPSAAGNPCEQTQP